MFSHNVWWPLSTMDRGQRTPHRRHQTGDTARLSVTLCPPWKLWLPKGSNEFSVHHIDMISPPSPLTNSMMNVLRSSADKPQKFCCSAPGSGCPDVHKTSSLGGRHDSLIPLPFSESVRGLSLWARALNHHTRDSSFLYLYLSPRKHCKPEYCVSRSCLWLILFSIAVRF